jgi:DNA-binding LytR/AlgR family response regulator
MLREIKVGIVEDELIIAEKIKMYLQKEGYLLCEPATNYEDALTMIESEKPDILLLDINLKEKKDGIDLAKTINEKYHLPFIFLTANSDNKTIIKAKEVNPGAFLVKPFKQADLFAAIEIAFNSHTLSKKTSISNKPGSISNEYIFIRDGHRFIKLKFDEIVYIESQENYVIIHLKNMKNSIVRSTFSDFLSKLPSEKFIRTHRSYAVQLNLIENIEPKEIVLNGYKIPISNSYREDVFKVLGLK